MFLTSTHTCVYVHLEYDRKVHIYVHTCRLLDITKVQGVLHTQSGRTTTSPAWASRYPSQKPQPGRTTDFDRRVKHWCLNNAANNSRHPHTHTLPQPPSHALTSLPHRSTHPNPQRPNQQTPTQAPLVYSFRQAALSKP
ncbi:hypothetical protein P154DRAFT_525468 [Amniculicola lignicola CBS 123094]|uniref:Uncharacterized protein n=1 Tax=Amniculicola lignicola CBS 123094 TaxID=1392246 RepID=A0A6A5W463_9PLEO|nr:hypothetical protein P154DRAFT_525468 [Amniculicola lignicola CBS 123094]